MSVDTEQGQITLDRGNCGQPFALDFGTTRSCEIEPGAITANIFIDKSVFEIFINKRRKSIFWSRLPRCRSKWNCHPNGAPTGTYYHLDYGRIKLTDVAQLAGVSPTTVSRVINKKDTYLKNHSKCRGSHA